MGETVPPPEQVSEHVHPTSSATACHNLPMGDRFIELGGFRLAAIDDTHFSISHRNGMTAQIFRSDGHVANGPRTDFGSFDR